MNNNNHNHPSCDFSETLVSYLYGETSATESDKFKAHAAKCVTCSAELAQFTAVRSQLAEWRQEEFAPVSVPAIELPARREAVILTDDESRSWIDGIRAFFTPKVGFALAGFAAIAICVGLTLVILNSQGGNDNDMMAVNSSPKEEIKSTANPENGPTAKEESKEEVAKTRSSDMREGAKENEHARVKTGTGRVRENPNAPVRNNGAVAKSKDTPKNIKPKMETLETDIYKDTEDDSLRLADLFSGIDAY